ncbi:twin-arginine translocase subunit TatC [Amnibacterium sp.]|uniref:twin-arginine translocase subunit TatC n=1 Tax=Amnibacterium sp. TaxID=1872496 RepID=UPI002618DFF8|nr:twin-arginine translocase subunit TatC [Amnibacterium sp.]MCU1473253.1 tatC [Amnibacterium sp.]
MAEATRVRDTERRMPLVEHLIELRKRLMRAALGVLVGGVAGWFLNDLVLNALRNPLLAGGKASERFSKLNFTGITSAFDVKFEIAIVLGIVVSSPIWLYQIFAFITPAFTRTEKKYVFGFFFSAVPLFLIGCAAGWLLVPHIVELMTGFAGTQDATLVDAKTYLDFVLRLVLIIGVAFVLPVFLVLLNFAGVIRARAILKGWRIAILVTIVFTALATPSADVISMLLLAAPLIALYFGSVGVAYLHDRRVDRRADAELTAL